MSLLSTILRKLRPAPALRASVALNRLDLARGPVYAIGDPHGCLDLLREVEAVIAQDSPHFAGRPTIVLLGDMIDRGPDSSGLLDHLLRPLPWADRILLRGNHEEMMLAFIDAPQAHSDWLDFGGYETLMSYGLALDPREVKASPPRRIQQKIAAYLPDEHLALLRSTVYGLLIEDSHDPDRPPIALAHAGYDPARGPDQQDPMVLIWGGVTPSDHHGPRLVHGHIISDQIDPEAVSIGIDTGAYKSGRLSVLQLASHLTPRHLVSTQPFIKR